MIINIIHCYWLVLRTEIIGGICPGYKRFFLACGESVVVDRGPTDHFKELTETRNQA